jgi:hypothetical protein
MKKQILISLMTICSILLSNAQSWTGTNPVYTSSKVGIGTSSPSAGLHVITSDNSSGNSITAILGNNYNDWTLFGGTTGGRIRGSNEGYLALESNPAGSGDKKLYLNYGSAGDICAAYGGGNVGIGVYYPAYKLDVAGDLHLSNSNHSIFLRMGAVDNSNYETAIRTRFVDGNGSFMDLGAFWGSSTNFTSFLTITPTGNVGIGTTTPGVTLDVIGTIRTQEVKVCLNQGCDFVFNRDYKLMDLNTLDKYVKNNKHLPEIASETEMVQNGVNMKEFQMKLLQKIEELTLYTIEQDKKLQEQNMQNEVLQKKIKTLEELINQKLK